MEQPEGFITKGQENKVCKLKKSLYGLKQAPLVWNKTLNEVLIKRGYERCINDPCLYHKHGNIMIAIYVDDIIITGKSLEEIEVEKTALKSHFNMTDDGDISSLLGVDITRNRSKREIYLSQHKYINKILERFKMENCNKISTPISTVEKLSRSESKITNENIPYREAVGSLMYLMNLGLCFQT